MAKKTRKEKKRNLFFERHKEEWIKAAFVFSFWIIASDLFELVFNYVIGIPLDDTIARIIIGRGIDIIMLVIMIACIAPTFRDLFDK